MAVTGNGFKLQEMKMKAIIAEKPSVGMDIARVVGATEKMEGYCTGNGYMVTWAFGAPRATCPARHVWLYEDNCR